MAAVAGQVPDGQPRSAARRAPTRAPATTRVRPPVKTCLRQVDEHELLDSRRPAPGSRRRRPRSGHPGRAASTSARRYGRDRMTATGSGAGCPAGGAARRRRPRAHSTWRIPSVGATRHAAFTATVSSASIRTATPASSGSPAAPRRRSTPGRAGPPARPMCHLQQSSRGGLPSMVRRLRTPARADSTPNVGRPAGCLPPPDRVMRASRGCDRQGIDGASQAPPAAPVADGE